MKNVILIDYLTFTIKPLEGTEMDIAFMFRFMGFEMDDFHDIGHRMHYDHCYTSAHGASIYAPHLFREQEMGYCVQLSGSGCRYFESVLKDGEIVCNSDLWRSFFRRLRALNYEGYSINISRIDIAVDDISNDDHFLLDLEKIESSSNAREFVSQFRSMYDYTSKNILSGQEKGKCIYFGTMKSSTMCRFYDKLAEQRSKFSKDIEKLREFAAIRHWVRMEFVFKREQAIKLVNAICDVADFSSYYSQLVNGYIRFVDCNDANVTRRTLKDWWARFIGTVERVCLSVGDYKGYGFQKTLRYYEHSLSTTVFTILSRLSPSEFFELTLETAAHRLKKKHQLVIDGCEKDGVHNQYDLWHALNPIPVHERSPFSPV